MADTDRGQHSGDVTLIAQRLENLNSRKESTHNISMGSALRIRYAHPFGQQLWNSFKIYQLLLGRVDFILSKDPHLTEYFKLPIGIIEGLIQEIQEGTTARLRVSSGPSFVEEPITWKKTSSDSDIISIIASTIQAKPLGPELIMNITVELGNRKADILKKFAYGLEQLERILDNATNSTIRVVGFTTAFPEIVAWPLKHDTVDLIGKKLLYLKNFYMGVEGNEMIFGDYPRREVTTRDLRQDNRLRGIVKLSLRFQTPSGLREAEATGWLITTDIIVTAGHCVYSEKHGHLIGVDVHSIRGLFNKGSWVRKGVFAATHWGWYRTLLTKHDLAFIRLDKPFESKYKIPWTQTPTSGNKLPIRITGFPSDKYSTRRSQGMHMAKGEVTYDLKQTNNILEHRLDTFAGNSGSPILDDKGNVIGIHSGWTYKTENNCRNKIQINQGVIIDKRANDFNIMLRFLEQLAADHKKDKGVIKDVIGRKGEGDEIIRLRLW